MSLSSSGGILVLHSTVDIHINNNSIVIDSFATPESKELR
jgi:hypothetical protein